MIMGGISAARRGSLGMLQMGAMDAPSQDISLRAARSCYLSSVAGKVFFRSLPERSWG